MSWETCEAEDVKDLADNGVAVVGIKDGEIFIIAPEADFEPEEGHENIRTMSELDEDTIDGIAFFAATNTATGGGSTTPKIPTRIAQTPNTTDWTQSLWGDYWTYAQGSGCGVACVSMALSCIGINKTPYDIMTINKKYNPDPTYMSWDRYGVSRSTGSTLNILRQYVANYKANPAKYAPPIAAIKTPNSDHHYIVICDIYSNGTFYAVDPGENGTDYYHWNTSNLKTQMMQYHL